MKIFIIMLLGFIIGFTLLTVFRIIYDYLLNRKYEKERENFNKQFIIKRISVLEDKVKRINDIVDDTNFSIWEDLEVFKENQSFINVVLFKELYKEKKQLKDEDLEGLDNGFIENFVSTLSDWIKEIYNEK